MIYLLMQRIIPSAFALCEKYTYDIYNMGFPDFHTFSLFTKNTFMQTG